MNERKSFEAIIGAIIILICCLFFSHIVNTNKQVEKQKFGKILYANFTNIEGIKVGSEVRIGGVRVGMVKDAKLKTGLLGGKFLNIKPGVDDDILQNGGSFTNTISTLNLEDLIGKVVASFTSK